MLAARSWAATRTAAAWYMPFCWTRARSLRSTPPGSGYAQAIDINAAGQIVGGFEPPGHHGFLLDKGTFTLIDFPGAFGTDALGINAAGQIVGRYVDASSLLHGFLLDKGAFTTIDPPGSTFTEAIGINTAGQIVGDYLDASGTQHGFLATP
jgi:uncharacterized membrane protein